jgi:hypothetical protein
MDKTALDEAPSVNTSSVLMLRANCLLFTQKPVYPSPSLPAPICSTTIGLHLSGCALFPKAALGFGQNLYRTPHIALLEAILNTCPPGAWI